VQPHPRPQGVDDGRAERGDDQPAQPVVAGTLEVEQHVPPPPSQGTVTDALDVEEHGRALTEAAVPEQRGDVLVTQDRGADRRVGSPVGGACGGDLGTPRREVGRGHVELMGGDDGHVVS
jgi:hypothetical protein